MNEKPDQAEVKAQLAVADADYGRRISAGPGSSCLAETASRIHIGRATLAAQVRYLVDIIRDLKRGDCWCRMAIGGPHATHHTDECEAAKQILDE